MKYNRMTEEERAAWARSVMDRLDARCDSDPNSDPFAAKVQALRSRARAGLPLCVPNVETKAARIADNLSPLTKKAVRAVLENE